MATQFPSRGNVICEWEGFKVDAAADYHAAFAISTIWMELADSSRSHDRQRVSPPGINRFSEPAIDGIGHINTTVRRRFPGMRQRDRTARFFRRDVPVYSIQPTLRSLLIGLPATGNSGIAWDGNPQHRHGISGE